ncbi:MAG: ATP-binding cassette domain-containing protein [Chloroflexota bacterium]|nr:ATP-binding cassette domain-containing protein [Chloroflexota bacterium]
MIELENVTKYYGDFPAITDISFRVEQGEVLGFLGPNGAGKTTTMKIVTGFIPPSSGTVTIAGYDVVSNSLEARKHIGYLPETVPLYTDMTVEEYLAFMGTIRGMDRKKLTTRIGDVVEVCRLEEYQTSHISKLSKGFRQRVGIAQAILHEPDVLILDEPTIGIDPIQIIETRQLIKDLAGDHTVIISTHILPEVSMLCQRVIIIHEGEIVAVDKPDNLGTRLRGSERVELELNAPASEATKAIEALEDVVSVSTTDSESGNATRLLIDTVTGSNARSKIASMVVHKGWDLLTIKSTGMTLEEIFVSLTTNEEMVQ